MNIDFKTGVELLKASVRIRRAAWLALVAGLAFQQNALALVSLPFYDNIPGTYASGGSLGASGVDNVNWSLGAPDTNIIVSITNAQSYAGLLPPVSGSQGVLVKPLNNENALAAVGVGFNSVGPNPDNVTTNSLYSSFLLKVIARPTANARTVASFSTANTVPTSGNGDLCIVLTVAGKLALGRNSANTISSTLSPTLTVGTTYFVVARYNFVPGVNNDTVDLWLNPTNLGVADASIPVATIPAYTATNVDVVSLQSFFICKQASASDTGSWALDEFRIGTNWASVTPSGVSIVSLPFYENFPSNYTTGGTLGSSDVGSTNWSLGAPDTNIIVTSAAAQSYAGLLAPPAGSQGLLINTISNENALAAVGVNFNPVTTNANGVSTNSLYASFLLKINTLPTLNTRCVATFNHTNSVPAAGNGDLAVGLTTAGGLVLGRGTVNTTSTNSASLTVGTSYLVVIRYNFIPGLTNDTADLWLNPTSLGVGESSVPTPTIPSYLTSTNADVTNLVSFFVPKQASGGDPASWSLDEIRIGTNWASVTPPAATKVLPVITSIQVIGTSVTIDFTCSDNSAASNFALETTPGFGPSSWGTNSSAMITSVGTGSYQAVTTESGGGVQYYRVAH